MRKKTKTRIGLLVGIALAVAVAAPVAAHARTLYGVDSDGRLVTFADKKTKVKVKSKQGKAGLRLPAGAAGRAIGRFGISTPAGQSVKLALLV